MSKAPEIQPEDTRYQREPSEPLTGQPALPGMQVPRHRGLHSLGRISGNRKLDEVLRRKPQRKSGQSLGSFLRQGRLGL